MKQKPISSNNLIQKNIQELYAEMESSPDGLSTAEAAKRLAQYGPNALDKKKESPLITFLRFSCASFAGDEHALRGLEA